MTSICSVRGFDFGGQRLIRIGSPPSYPFVSNKQLFRAGGNFEARRFVVSVLRSFESSLGGA